MERQGGEEAGVLIAFEADGGGAEPVSGLIAAGSLEARVGAVRRYLSTPRPTERPGGKSAGPASPSPP
ncbi:hypothetical protein [Streptomyces sp. LS1784]|uniref:hypothetical protein n=1 Tax=Streptomyces sp. LS1784 TaxID=2851533 RepID=UPI001CC9E06D|nr:hypothetical protein [Streptomyces sp. LS1784]